MRKKQVKPYKNDKKYRCYSKDTMLKAYKLVKDEGLPVKTVAKMFKLPQSTLRDRVLEKVDPFNFGQDTLFSKEEELKFIEHLKSKAELGNQMTNREIKRLAGEMAYELDRRNTNNALSNKWFYAFLKRWPKEMAPLRPPLNEGRTAENNPSSEITSTYFLNLEAVMEENDLLNKPHNIYNLDETSIQQQHKPKSGSKSNGKSPTKSSPESSTTTLIGCVNAMGHAVPPYFVFKGDEWNEVYMKGACNGAKGTMSENGLSNCRVFRKYLEEHFIPFARPSSSCTEPLLVIYDGHSSHKSQETIKWAKEQGIILFVDVPDHSSPTIDGAIFGRFKKYYYSECSQYLTKNKGKTITKYDISSLASTAYLKSLTPLKVQDSFKRTGIYPLDKSVVEKAQILVKPPCKQEKRTARRKGNNSKSKTSTSKLTQPSTSSQHHQGVTMDIDSDTDTSDDDDDDEDKCCVCGRSSPPRPDDCLKIIGWAQCDKCEHWVHLAYCTKERVVRKRSLFLCPHCKHDD